MLLMMFLLLGLGGGRVPEESGVGNHSSDNVRVHVGGWPAILEVSLAIDLGVSAHSDGCSSVGNSPREGVHVGCLVTAGQSSLVALSV